ncbi:MAG TPA: FecR family protein, partial [Polyangiaceae bacterium]
MSDRVRVEDVLKRMGSAAVPADDDAGEREQRARAVAAMNARLDVISEGKRRRRRTRILALAAAAALGLGVAASVLFVPGRVPSSPAPGGVSLVHAVQGDVEIVHAGQRVRASSAAPSTFGAMDEIHTTAGARASAELPSGAKVSVAESSLVRLSAVSNGTEELGLEVGRVDVSVPHLRSGATLSVRTPDARVTVRGTRFVVEVAARDARSVTSVSVLEGSVWVETRGQKLVLEPGARWTSGVAPLGASEPPRPAESVGSALSRPVSAPSVAAGASVPNAA